VSTPGDDPPAGCELAHLPTEPVDPLTQAFVHFLGIQAAAGAVLLLFTVRLRFPPPWAGAFQDVWKTPVGLQFGSMEYVRSLRDWINDGLMTPGR
jgi:NhaA family Na+:H+ antiporter